MIAIDTGCSVLGGVVWGWFILPVAVSRFLQMAIEVGGAGKLGGIKGYISPQYPELNGYGPAQHQCFIPLEPCQHDVVHEKRATKRSEQDHASYRVTTASAGD